MKKLHIKKVLAMFLAVALVVPSSASNLTASAATTQESNDESAISEGYTPIYDAADLYAIRNDLDGKYIMMAESLQQIKEKDDLLCSNQCILQ